MTLFDFILLSLAMAIVMMMVVRDCAAQTSIKLTKALLMMGVIALFHALFAFGGVSVGRMLGLDLAVDNMIFLGCLVFVALKLFFVDFRKNKEVVAYDIARLGTVMLLAIATGINTFLLGIGCGFLCLEGVSDGIILVPMFVCVWLFSMWGVMLGRQKVEIRQRRWLLFALIFIFVVALRGAFWA